MARVIVPAFGFTPDQQKQYDSLVPEVPEEAVAQILREWNWHDQEEDLRQEAYVGTAEGVRTWEDNGGMKLKPWVFFCALHAAQAARRQERRQTSRVVARFWDGVMTYCKGQHHRFGVMGNREEDRATLTEFRNGVPAAACVSVAALEVPAGGGEDEAIARLTAARCEQGVAVALGAVSGRRHETLRLKYADDQPVKETAAVRGEKGYRAELNQFNRSVAIVAARLHGMGFDELPPFPREAGETILRPSSDPPPAPDAQRTEP